MKSNMIKHIALILLLGVTTVAYAQTDRQLVREGNRFFTKGQYDKAEVQYRKAIKKDRNKLYDLDIQAYKSIYITLTTSAACS